MALGGSRSAEIQKHVNPDSSWLAIPKTSPATKLPTDSTAALTTLCLLELIHCSTYHTPKFTYFTKHALIHSPKIEGRLREDYTAAFSQPNFRTGAAEIKVRHKRCRAG